jgi:hypothetical protein
MTKHQEASVNNSLQRLALDPGSRLSCLPAKAPHSLETDSFCGDFKQMTKMTMSLVSTTHSFLCDANANSYTGKLSKEWVAGGFYNVDGQCF